MTDGPSTEQQWIRGRLDRIDENLVKILVGQTAMNNKVETLESRVAELEEGQETLDRKIDAALLPGRAIRWLLAALAAGAATLTALKAAGVRISVDAAAAPAEDFGGPILEASPAEDEFASGQD